MIGGAGSIMLELYGWESVFYISGILAVLWAYCMWKCMLKGEGNCSDTVICKTNKNQRNWQILPGLVIHVDILLYFNLVPGYKYLA